MAHAAEEALLRIQYLEQRKFGFDQSKGRNWGCIGGKAKIGILIGSITVADFDLDFELDDCQRKNS
jgi:hypothetical protein